MTLGHAKVCTRVSARSMAVTVKATTSTQKVGCGQMNGRRWARKRASGETGALLNYILSGTLIPSKLSPDVITMANAFVIARRYGEVGSVSSIILWSA